MIGGGRPLISENLADTDAPLCKTPIFNLFSLVDHLHMTKILQLESLNPLKRSYFTTSMLVSCVMRSSVGRVVCPSVSHNSTAIFTNLPTHEAPLGEEL